MSKLERVYDVYKHSVDGHERHLMHNGRHLAELGAAFEDAESREKLQVFYTCSKEAPVLTVGALCRYGAAVSGEPTA